MIRPILFLILLVGYCFPKPPTPPPYPDNAPLIHCQTGVGDKLVPKRKDEQKNLDERNMQQAAGVAKKRKKGSTSSLDSVSYPEDEDTLFGVRSLLTDNATSQVVPRSVTGRPSLPSATNSKEDMSSEATTSTNPDSVEMIKCVDFPPNSLLPCPAKNTLCKNKTCYPCLIEGADSDTRGERRCFGCQEKVNLKDLATVLGFKQLALGRPVAQPLAHVQDFAREDHVVVADEEMDFVVDEEDMEFDNNEVPNVVQPRHDPGQDFDNACDLGGTCIRQDPNNDQTKVKCPSCFRHYHVECLREEIRIAEQRRRGDEIKCHCNIRSKQMWQQYVLDPRKWITDEDDLR